MIRPIFVFGSNLAGRHGGGAALHAAVHHGAVYGQGYGLQGTSFAIPTKDMNIQTLPLTVISSFVIEFIKYAENHDEMMFNLTKIGCGLAGYTEKEIAPMFADAPANVFLIDDFGDLDCLASEWHLRLS